MKFVAETMESLHVQNVQNKEMMTCHMSHEWELHSH